MAYIGKTPLVGNYQVLDALVATTTDTYALTKASVAVFPHTPANCIVSLNGVIQAPVDSYTISGSNIVFASALTGTDSIDFITVLGDVLSIGTPSDDSVTTAKIQDGAITSAKLAEGAGSLSWQSIQTTGFTAVVGNAYPCDTTSSAFTITLPASASVGNQIQIVDYAGTFATNNITLTSSLNIEGATSDKILTTNREGVTITYVDATQGWVASSGVNSGDQALDPPPYSVDFLVVAGGGGGGASGSGGGGGGGGGYRTSTQTVNIGTVITVTVGDGGSSISDTNATSNSGSDSSISGSGLTTITSAGGGGGGTNITTGKNGGSGGGGAGLTSRETGGSGNTPSTSPSQGNNGGTATSNNGYNGAGGGGASAVGTVNVGTSGGVSGNGGNGTASSITGSSVTYAGGASGSGYNGTLGSSGTGGGGAGGLNSPSTAATSGTANLGGGGGGSRNDTGGGGASGAGGKGVVILSMPDASYSGTTTGSPTVATGVSGNTVLTFTGTGSYTT